MKIKFEIDLNTITHGGFSEVLDFVSKGFAITHPPIPAEEPIAEEPIAEEPKHKRSRKAKELEPIQAELHEFIGGLDDY